MYKKLIELKRLFQENNIDEEFAETLFILCGGKKFYDIGLVLLNCIKKGTFDFDDYVSTSKYLFMVAPVKELDYKKLKFRVDKDVHPIIEIYQLPEYLKNCYASLNYLQFKKNDLRLTTLKLFKI